MKNRITNSNVSSEEQNGSLFNFFTVFCVLFFLLVSGIHILNTQEELKSLKKDFKVLKNYQDSVNAGLLTNLGLIHSVLQQDSSDRKVDSLQNNILEILVKEKSR